MGGTSGRRAEVQWLIAQRGSVLDDLESTLRTPDQLGSVLVGLAGVGKTLLARSACEHFASWHEDNVAYWIAGTSSASTIPFGAFSHLIDVVSVGESATVLRAARASLECHRSASLLIVVDDAHHLDSLSATFVHQLALTASARLIITVRAGEPVPDAITALWKDGLLTRMDIEAFDRASTLTLLEQVLDGPLETASADRIFRVSEGNPLYLRHLVEGALKGGALRQVEGVWQLRGALVLNPQLSTLIGEYVASLPRPAQAVLEYLAVHEPLTLGDLSSLVGRDAVEQAEALNAVRVSRGGDDLAVNSGHPLYAEVIRRTLGRVAARRLRTAVVTQLSTRPSTHVSDRLALAALALDSDNPQPVADVVAAAHEALRLGDLVLGERLARGALERSDDMAARVALAHALGWQGRGREADDVLSSVDPESLSEWDGTAWMLYKVANQFWMLREPEEATAALQAMRSRVSQPAALNTIDALAATFAMYTGDPWQAREVAGEVLASPCAPDLAVAWAAATATLCSARLGRFAEVASLAERSLAAPHLGLLRFNTALGEITTLLLNGQLIDAQRLARRYLEFTESQQPGRAIGELLLARTLITAGDFAAAVRLLRQATAALTDTGYTFGALVLMYLAEALGQQGEATASASVLAAAQSRHGTDSELFAPELGLARAWTLAAARSTQGAIEAARSAAQIAERAGQSAVALSALHDAVRLGDSRAAPGLARISARADCAVGRLALAHGRALAAGDGAALDAASSGLAALGMNAAAADASAQAAVAYAARNQPKSELAAQARAAELARRGGRASTPALERVLNPLPLTKRQHEIAVMVAAGLSNKSIADRLRISVRTVEGHLYCAFARLDVPDRTTLAQIVAARETPRSGSS
jgi:DNA-binding CsgD family transcriptional regulator